MKLRLRMVVAFAACATASPFAVGSARGQQAPSATNDAKTATPAIPRLPDGHPNLNGFYASSSGPDTPVGATFGPPDPNRKRGGGGAKERHEDPNQPPYKPELLAKVKDLAANESKMDPAFYCKPGGVPRIGPPHGVIQAPGMPIVFLYQLTAGNAFRVVNADGRPHDPDADSSYFGESVAQWEGDTLVVDTTHLNDDTWLGLDGWFHSSKMHVVERMTRTPDAILYQATVEDPEVFTRPWVMNQRIARYTTEQIVESPPCIETDISHITTFDEKTRVQ